MPAGQQRALWVAAETSAGDRQEAGVCVPSPAALTIAGIRGLPSVARLWSTVGGAFPLAELATHHFSAESQPLVEISSLLPPYSSYNRPSPLPRAASRRVRGRSRSPAGGVYLAAHQYIHERVETSTAMHSITQELTATPAEHTTVLSAAERGPEWMDAYCCTPWCTMDHSGPGATAEWHQAAPAIIPPLEAQNHDSNAEPFLTAHVTTSNGEPDGSAFGPSCGSGPAATPTSWMRSRPTGSLRTSRRSCRSSARRAPCSPPLGPADGLAQPVVQLGHQARVPPAGEEGIHARPGRKVAGHRPPLDAVVDEVAHRVDHAAGGSSLPAARPGLPAIPAPAAVPAPEPIRHRSCPTLPPRP